MTVKHVFLFFCSVAMALVNASGESIVHSPKVPATLPINLNLPTALRMADENNPQLRQARERINESKSAMKVTRSNMFPDLDASGLYQRDHQDSVGSFGGESTPDEYYWRAGVQLTQPLYSGGKLRHAYDARKYELQSVEYNVTTTRSRILSDVYRKFYDALLSKEALNVQQESLDLITQQLQIASNRFAAGAGAKFDVLQAEVRVANAKPPLIRAASNYKTTIDDLRTTIGVMYPNGVGPKNITLSGEWSNMASPGDLETAIAKALESRPELLATIKMREAAKENVRKTQGDRAPIVDLYAGYGFENDRFDPSNDTLEGWQVGIQARLSLWSGGEVSGEIARYKSQVAQLEDQIEAEKLGIELEVRNAWNDAEESRELLSATEFVIAQAKEALRMAQNRYGAGALTQLDVLASELEYTQSRLENITAARNFNIAVIEFKRAVGDVPGLEHVQANAP